MKNRTDPKVTSFCQPHPVFLKRDAEGATRLDHRALGKSTTCAVISAMIIQPFDEIDQVRTDTLMIWEAFLLQHDPFALKLLEDGLICVLTTFVIRCPKPTKHNEKRCMKHNGRSGGNSGL